MCIYTQKNIIEYYRRDGHTVFTCFIDASRAFNRVEQFLIHYSTEVYHQLLYDYYVSGIVTKHVV